MKSCPTCSKTFADPNLIYCVDDGTPLVPLSSDDDELTEVKPPAYQPPSYVPPGGSAKKRSIIPWVIGITVFALALIGSVVAGIIFIPRLVNKSREVVANSNSRPNDQSNNQTDHNSNGSTDDPNSNAKDGENSNSASPTDKDVVLQQLKDLEHEWTVANINADKKKLRQILADDYVGPNGEGRMQGKEEYINTIERDTNIQKWEFDDLRLSLRGDRATLLGKVRFELQDREVIYDFVDRFVWRDGRWQATGSEVTLNQ